MSSLRPLVKFRSFQSICGYYRLNTCHSNNITRGLKIKCALNKDGDYKLIKLPKRLISGQELSPQNRKKEYLYRETTPKGVPIGTIFPDNENQISFKIIDLLLSFQKFELSKEYSFFNAQSQDILDQFLNINPEQYEDQSFLISEIVSILRNLNLKQICDVLESMVNWPVINPPFNKYFYKLWSNVDKELETRLTKVNFSNNEELLQYFFIGNLFYRLKVANISKFNYLLVRKLSAPDFELNKISLVHLMFYINLHRRIDTKTVPYLLKQSEKLVKDMNLNEIGVICKGFFKTDTKLSDNLSKLIISKVLTDVSEQTDNIIRCAITKSLRRSANYRIKPQIQQFLNKMKELSNNSELTLTHMLSLKAIAQIYDPQLIANVFDRVCSDPTDFRIKDIERILLCLSIFNYKLDENKLKTLCHQLHEKSETMHIYDYPMCVLNILHYLTVWGHYPKPMIERCFEPTFLGKTLKYSKVDYQRHLLTANTALSVEKFDEYKELLLPPEKVYRCHRWILNQEKSAQENITKRSALINSVYMTLKSKVNKKVQLCHIFPFKSYPLVVIFDKNDRHFHLSPKTELKANMFDNCLVIYILDIQDFAVVDTIVKGLIELELRLLKKMGFKVVTIPWHHLTCYNTNRARSNKLMAEISLIDPNFTMD